MEYSIISKVDNGKVNKFAYNQIEKCLQSFEGKIVRIKIELETNQRSNKQNRYLHALFTIFKNELNQLGNDFTMLQVKDLCKCKFLTYDEVNKDTGEVIGRNIKETHKLSKEEMKNFIEQIIQWGAEYFSIKLPYPSENFEINFKD